jgi:hypothetical protein
MKRSTVLVLLLAVALAVAATASSAATSTTSALKKPVLICVCDEGVARSDSDVLRAIRPFAYGPGLFRATPTVRAAGGRVPGGVYRAAVLEDSGAFGG